MKRCVDYSSLARKSTVLMKSMCQTYMYRSAKLRSHHKMGKSKYFVFSKYG